MEQNWPAFFVTGWVWALCLGLLLGLAQGCGNGGNGSTPATTQSATPSSGGNGGTLGSAPPPGLGPVCPTSQRELKVANNSQKNIWVSGGGGALRAVCVVNTPDWQASNSYAKNDVIVPTSNNAGNYAYAATTGGTSGSSEPTFSQTPGGTTADGSVTWTNIGTPTTPAPYQFQDSCLVDPGTPPTSCSCGEPVAGEVSGKMSCPGTSTVSPNGKNCSCAGGLTCGATAACNTATQQCYFTLPPPTQLVPAPTATPTPAWNWELAPSGSAVFCLKQAKVTSQATGTKGNKIPGAVWWSGGVSARTGCKQDGTHCATGGCLTGSEANQNCSPGVNPNNPATISEFTLQSPGNDFYDVTVINGANIVEEMKPLPGPTAAAPTPVATSTPTPDPAYYWCKAPGALGTLNTWQFNLAQVPLPTPTPTPSIDYTALMLDTQKPCSSSTSCPTGYVCTGDSVKSGACVKSCTATTDCSGDTTGNTVCAAGSGTYTPQTLTRGSGTYDDLGGTIPTVESVVQSSTTYVQGTDYQLATDPNSNSPAIKWLNGGSAPTTGTTYTATYVQDAPLVPKQPVTRSASGNYDDLPPPVFGVLSITNNKGQALSYVKGTDWKFTTDPNWNGTKKPGPAIEWLTSNEPASGNTYYINYFRVSGMWCQCQTQSDCSTASGAAGTYCGTQYAAQDTTYLQECGKFRGWYSADDFCAPYTNVVGPFDCGASIYDGDASTTTDLASLLGCTAAGTNGDPANAASCYNSASQAGGANPALCCGCATAAANPLVSSWPTQRTMECVQNGAVVSNNPAWASAVQPWLVNLKTACPTCYSYPFDDPTSTFQCRSTGSKNMLGYNIIFKSLPTPAPTPTPTPAP